jgi:xylulose-5-phosphate/fructose-6-phosphate phosphoketolase
MMAETATAGPGAGVGPLDQDELDRLDAWWRAANYVSVGQIVLLDNPLLRPGSPPPAEAATDN